MWKRIDDYSGYCAKEKIGNQEIIVCAYNYDLHPNRFYIDACVYSKRKDILSNFYDKKVTGKNGMKPLLAIRRMIISLEEFLQEKTHEDFEIVIFWTDNKRRDVYIYGLKDYGYKIGMRENRKCLIKKITKGERC